MGEPYSGLVLVVDGDAELRRAMRDYLMQSGCAVLEARDAYDALFIIAQYGKSINLLITEINLLPVGGIKLAENALRLVPSLQVICTSADVEMRGVKYWMRYLSADFLPKPFAPHQLREKVFALLGHRYEDAPMPILDYGREPWMEAEDRKAGRAIAAAALAVPAATATASSAAPPLPARTPPATRWEAFRPHMDMSKPTSSNDDPLFWLKEF
jgi:DNA-binding NtrC family response regulator